MGLFSSIGHIFKSVVHGVGRVAGGVIKRVAAPIVRTGLGVVTHGLSEKLITAVHLAKAAGPGMMHAEQMLAAPAVPLGAIQNTQQLAQQILLRKHGKLGHKIALANALLSTVRGSRSTSTRRSGAAPGALRSRGRARTYTRRRAKSRTSTRRRHLPPFGGPAWRRMFFGKRGSSRGRRKSRQAA
jgi:hypothetical protein